MAGPQPAPAAAPKPQPVHLEAPSTANVTSVSLAGAIEKPPASAADTLRAKFEQAQPQRPIASPPRQPQEERLSAKLLGK